ncbi:MAG: hypothetical protein ACRD96_24795, partial [Bryobacteraceae bacterium]
AVSIGSRAEANVRLEVGASVETVAVQAGTLGNRTRPTPTPAPPAATVAEARAQAQSIAFAQDLGDLFEYKLKEPITIQKNQSALVPIVQTPVEIEKVSLWNAAGGPARPQRALWLTNSNELTLDGGSFSVLEEEAFAGEGIFEAIRPGEKRLVSYALDLALAAASRQESVHQRVTRVRAGRGILTQHSEVRETTTYTFRNEDSSARTVLVEHPVREGHEIRGAARPVETSRGWMRFRLPVGPKQTAALAVEEGRPIEASYTVGSIRAEQLAQFVRERSINPALEEALRRIQAQQGVVAGYITRKSERESEQEQIFDDQQRLRENIKSLRGSAEEKSLLQRYTQQLNRQEDRLEALRKEIEQLAEQMEKAQAEVDRLVEELAIDARL